MSNLSPYFIQRNGSPANPVYLLPPSAAQNEAGIGLSDCCNVIARRWRILAYGVGAAMLLTAIVVVLLPRQYTATATVLIDPEPPRIMDASSLLNKIQNGDEDDYRKTQYSLLQSDQLIARVVSDLDLEKGPMFGAAKDSGLSASISYLWSSISYLWSQIAPSEAPRAERLGVSARAINAYRSRLSIVPEGGTRLVRVSFKSLSPGLSADIVNKHVSDYVALQRQLQSQGDDASREFLQKELITIKDKVEKSEAALNSYRAKMGIVSFGIHDQEKNAIAEQTMINLTKQLTDAEAERIKAESEMQLVKSGEYDSLPEVVDNLMIQNLEPQVDQLQAEYAESASKYTNEYPRVRQLGAKLNEAKRRLAREMAAIARAVQRHYVASLSRQQELEQRIGKEKEQDFARNDASLQDAILVREVDTNRQLYKNVLQRMQEISVNGEAPLPNIALAETAVPPSLPSSPKKAMDLALSGLIAAIGSIGLIFFLDRSDDRLKSPEEIETFLHLPELGIIPDLARVLAKPEIALPNHSLTGALSRLSNSTVDKASKTDVAFRRPGDLMEIYRSIRTALMYSNAGGAPKTILFTSAVPGEGKTMTASGTAWAFAQTGARTLLIDADLREPRCHKVLTTDNSLGLSEILVDLASSEHATQRLGHKANDGATTEGLFFLGAGSPVPNPSELLTSVSMFQLLHELSNQYQFVLLDSAPVAFASDTLGLATMVDGVVVIAGADTPKSAVRAVCRRLSDAGAKIFGVVINRVDASEPAFRNHTSSYAQYSSYVGRAAAN
jgi:succinoglycan biosynthesis transport protein ExoP